MMSLNGEDPVVQKISSAIKEGRFPGRLPGIITLSWMFKANPFRVKRALDQIIKDGVVKSSRKKRSTGEIAILFYRPTPLPSRRVHALQVFSSFMDGVQSYALGKNIRTCMHQAAPNQTEFIEMLKNDVDAIIVVAHEDITNEEFAVFDGIPWVRAMGVVKAHSNHSFVTYDNSVAGTLAADYLLSRGCRKIIYLGCVKSQLFGERHQSFVNRIKASESRTELHEIKLDGMEISSPNVMAAAVKVLSKLTLDGKAGIFAAADIYASALYQALYSLGVEPVSGVKIVSCDKCNFFLDGLTPRPPSVDVRMFDIGQLAAEIVTGPDWQNRHEILIPELNP